MNVKERDELIDALIDGEISEADFLRLEAELSVDPAARRAYYDRIALSTLLKTEAQAPARQVAPVKKQARYWTPGMMAMAAAVVALLLTVGVLLQGEVAPAEEQKASGFAVLAGQAEAVWATGAALADGSLLPAGPLHLASGVAQIELFSGVTVIVEGAAEFEVVSAMEMSVKQGRVRAHVPEPARGFRIHTSAGEVVDLGTEFAMNVSQDQSEVHVLDGEVEWHPRSKAMHKMAKGEALRWDASGQKAELPADAAEFVGIPEMNAKMAAAREKRRAEWLLASAELCRDPRLLACYQMSAATGRVLPNKSAAGASKVGEAAIVAATRVADRWDTPGAALDFSPAGSRVRVSVPEEHHALTLMTWVKINSLDRLYNSLFLTDGHDLGEPHWQIMSDGRLFFSVKKHANRNGRPDKHIFYSPVIWNPSLSGQWLMIATVYDPDGRRVTHYLNGRPVSSEVIPDDYLVDRVSIGAASIGNWNEPAYRKDPEFAMRNLNGSMDEFLLFKAALPAAEIARIYQSGRP